MKIYSTQDQQIQKIADSVTNDASNYPKATKIALSYSLSAKTVSGKDVVYSDHNLLDYMRKNNLGNQLIFTDEASARQLLQSLNNIFYQKVKPLQMNLSKQRSSLRYP